MATIQLNTERSNGTINKNIYGALEIELYGVVLLSV